jgi:hypothetical protein
MAEDQVCATGEAEFLAAKAEDPDKSLFYNGLYKAARMEILGKERFFVIPENTEIWELARETSLTISDEIMAQAPTWEKALLIAYAFNYSKLAKQQITRKVDSNG